LGFHHQEKTMTNGQLNPPPGQYDHSEGNTNAAVTLVEYGDYQCPYCGQAYPIVKRLQKEFGSRLRFVFRNCPLSMHPYAMVAAEMAEAAALQDKFWPMHDWLYEHQNALDPDNLMRHAAHLHLDMARVGQTVQSESVISRIRADMASGDRSGV